MDELTDFQKKIMSVLDRNWRRSSDINLQVRADFRGPGGNRSVLPTVSALRALERRGLVESKSDNEALLRWRHT